MSDDSNHTDAEGSYNTDAEDSQKIEAEGSQKTEVEDSQKTEVEDSQKTEADENSRSLSDVSGIEETQETEGGSQSSGLIVNDPDILASLKQLSDAVIEGSNQKTVQIQTPENIKNVVEGAIMAASKAISIDKILTLFSEKEDVDKSSIRQAIEQLMQDYQSRGIELIEVSSGFRFQVAQTVAPWVSRLWEERPQKYSRALLETLALVAYRQPVTRGEIEEIRGVSVSSQIMRTLVEREWVRVIGHRDVPGKPAMYATTKTFLDYFGLKKLDELPTLSEIRDLDVIDAELDFGDEKTGDEKTGDKETSDKDIANENQQVKGSEEQADLLQEDLSQESLNQEKTIDINRSELKVTLPIDSEQTNSSALKNNDESGEKSDDERLPSKRIDIDAELSALKETYQQIDAIEKKNEEPDPFKNTLVNDTYVNEIPAQNNSPIETIDIEAELNALKETQLQADATDKKEAVQDSEDDVDK